MDGAFDFIQKPIKPDEFQIVVERALKLHRLEVENDTLKQQLEERGCFENIIGSSPAMNQVFELVRKIADTQANVLVTRLKYPFISPFWMILIGGICFFFAWILSLD